MRQKYRIGLFLIWLFMLFMPVFAQSDDVPSGVIAYVMPTGITGGGELRLFNLIDASTQRLSPPNESPHDIAPHFSPDGAWIAFISDDKLAFIRPNGDDFIVTDIENPLHIAWAWDSTQVAFLTRRGDDYVINIYSLGTRENRTYAPPLNNLDSHSMPSWSMDGTFITYSTHIEAGTNTDIFRIASNFAPETIINLSNSNNISEFSPSVSPNGLFISYNSETDDIWVMSITGDNPRNLTAGRLSLGASDSVHQWSPDSTRVMIPDAGRGVAIIDIFTGEISDFEGENPTWSPDGRWVAYTRFKENRGGIAYSDLYIAPANNPRNGRVTLENVSSAGLSWQPDPSLTSEPIIPATPTPSATATPSAPQSQVAGVLSPAEMIDWYFDGFAGTEITIRLNSDDFDAYLQLYAPNGDLFAENDDHLSSTNSQITITLTTDGIYRVVVSAYYGDMQGSYNLTLAGIESELRDTTAGGIFMATATPTFTPTLRPSATPTVTATPTSPPTLTPTPTLGLDRGQCPPNLPPRLVMNGRGRVLPGGNSIIYEQPTPDSATLGEIPGGVSFAVLEGPVCADNRIWWQVAYRNITGWVIEGASGEYLLEPLRR